MLAGVLHSSCCLCSITHIHLLALLFVPLPHSPSLSGITGCTEGGRKGSAGSVER